MRGEAWKGGRDHAQRWGGWARKGPGPGRAAVWGAGVGRLGGTPGAGAEGRQRVVGLEGALEAGSVLERVRLVSGVLS